MDRAIAWQRAEGAIAFAAALAIFWHGREALPWWGALLWFFAPDLTFLFYLLGAKIGAVAYNGVHLYATGLAVLAAGTIAPDPLLLAIGALLLAHAGFDRMLGYGLKSPEGFAVTHLGRIGRRS